MSESTTAASRDGVLVTRVVPQLPEPSRLWIAHVPRSWRYHDASYVDLGRGRLSRSRRVAAEPPVVIEPAALDDLLYLPPVREDLRAARDAAVAELSAAGTPVLVQVRPGEAPPEGATVVVCDLLGVLLDGESERVAETPAGAIALWPLIPGLSDHPGLRDEAFEMLRAVGVDQVHCVVPNLDSSERRQLAEGRGEDVFDALFHGTPPSERQFAIAAHEHGLEPLPPRPAIGATERRQTQRDLAAALALAGELWLRCGRSTLQGQGLLRAARGVESSSRDLRALHREKNLHLMSWLDSESLEIVRELLDEGRSQRVEELRNEWLRLDPAS